MDDVQIKSLMVRLSRPHPSGGVVIERAAILADGSDYPAIMDWIAAHAGKPDTLVAATRSRGLHGARLNSAGRTTPQTPQRFVLPTDALD
jgi:hypothetical protein